MKHLSTTNTIPDEVLETGLDFAQALGVIRTWERSTVHYERRISRWYRVTFNDEQVSAWTAGMVAAFTLGVRLAALEISDEVSA